MMEADFLDKEGVFFTAHGFTDIVLSWSMEEIYEENLYRNEVENIPLSFESIERYFRLYVYPLLEETRAQLHSSMEIMFRAPFAEILEFKEKWKCGSKLFDVKVDQWRNRSNVHGEEPYKTLPGDIFVLADSKPEHVSDLQRMQWAFVAVTKIPDDEHEDNSTSTRFEVEAHKDIEVDGGIRQSLFVIFLTNIIHNKRIWNALHVPGNQKIIKKILCADSLIEEDCDLCSVQSDTNWHEKFGTSVTSGLDKSQTEAVLACLRKIHCNHKSAVELIWGPPGTGKTKTTSTLLFKLLEMGYRTLTCAPTNVAIKGVSSCVLELVKESIATDSGTDGLFCSVGDILLFGSKASLKLGSDIEEIYLDYRVQRLTEFLGPATGWRHCFASMIDILEDCVPQYHIFLENESIKEKEQSNEKEIEEGESSDKTDGSKRKYESFLNFLRERFVSTSTQLKNCFRVFCTHLPRKYILENNYQNMVSHIGGLLESFGKLLFQHNVESEALEKLFSDSELHEDIENPFVDISFLLHARRKECLLVLKNLRSSFNELDLPSSTDKRSIVEFCFRAASLLFCAASSSYKLRSVTMEPLNVLVVDEAAQLKECESTIPLQLPGLRHAILVGDECQLPAMVESNISAEAGFGRSLFERLILLGKMKHLLNVQYRMHPSISSFPNSNFYFNQILDASKVKRKGYEKQYLPWPMFGAYSFINIVGGREEKDDVGHGWRNLVEVAVVMKLLRKLYKGWVGSRQKLSVGVISPYAAQVAAIQDKLGRYDNIEGFAVKLKSVDGFQGGEEDIIILSTVRCNRYSSVGFMSKPQRTNVALTRARHCLWIVGNESTLANSDSVWEALVLDSKNRQCFFNADEDKDLHKAIFYVKKALDQFDDLLNSDSILFRNARWKVLFSDNFLKSFRKLKCEQQKKSAINHLLMLSNGWRPKKRSLDPVCESSSQMLKQFKIGDLYIICANDIVKEWSEEVEELRYIQVFKIWDILPAVDIPKLVKRLDSLLRNYTDDFLHRCKEKCLQGSLEVPKSWSITSDIVRIKNAATDGRNYVENAVGSESLMLMKFYSLSSGVVGQLLSTNEDGDLDLPFEVNDEEREVILFPRSTFIIGRSGTGKTTVLTMKLLEKEKLFHMAADSFGYEVTGNRTMHNQEIEEAMPEARGTILRQLFVTVSHKLCYVVKQHVSNLKSAACGCNSSKGSSSFDTDEFDDAAQFKDIPDSFVDVPPNLYPLVVTFQKFLLMLDGTLGNSYFERFHELWKLSHGRVRGRSVALQSFIRMKEVHYERFSSSYWTRFNTKLTKNLDSSRVFTQIISHIKGGAQASDGKLSRDEYIQLSESSVSSLSRQERELIYDIFQKYEKMKMENGDFDLADLVIDLHRRLRVERYGGDIIDFIYVDEVQDLTLSQIALFKYICKNVEEGFVFSGDTAQTIARGIDFRFQDIRSLFYNKFLLESKGSGHDKRGRKGIISDIFHLRQNFRTHDGVLKLAQSIIELIYHFFPQSIDVLEPETSLVNGEAPIFLQSGDNGNAIVTIFGNTGNTGASIVGFGAEQVILVRDDSVRNEIANFVGKQSLVLTILECKGLEFQDVMLYNFFGSSPLKNQWRVIYEYMKEQDMLDSTSPGSTSFSDAKHNVLCSELKQLYVAITRTRQRLWICEDGVDICRPMFDYWQKKCLVQDRKLDGSLVQAMQVASSSEEWRSQGIKLYQDSNYEMATMCFERAGDTYWKRRSKAAGLRSKADHMRHSNPEAASVILREAADIFEAIGKADYAALCFIDMEEYERAGRLYLEKCAESELEKAGECFFLAGCYELAADVYARGYFFMECLQVCTKGKLFDKGFEYIENWKQDETNDSGVLRRDKEIEKDQQAFIESTARHIYELKDTRSMMKFVKSMRKFVKAFKYIELMRKFLMPLGCLNELQLLEEESGNFLEAANIAKLRGEILPAADLLVKAGNFQEAARLILIFVLSNSIWAPGSKGWPLKQFTQKQELLGKAKSFAKNVSNTFYALVCTEADVLSYEQSNMSVMKNHLNACQRHNSVGGEIMSTRKIIDAHLHSSCSKYEWEDYLVSDPIKNSEQLISRNQSSVETLVYFWNFWRDQILKVLKYLSHSETQDVNERRSYREFCLNYFGVWKQFYNSKDVYVVLNSDADWVRKLDDGFLCQHGELVSIGVRRFVSTARNYWCSELLSVGLKVLENLEALYNFTIKNSLSMFSGSRCLALIVEVEKFLLESKHLNCSPNNVKALQRFLTFSSESYFGFIFPLDWRKSWSDNMLSLRETEVSNNLLQQVIVEIISFKAGKLTYGGIGRIVMVILGAVKVNNDLYEEILKRIDKDDRNPLWKTLIQILFGQLRSKFPHGTVPEKLHDALMDTCSANWRKEKDYISPSCFLYLIERLLILSSCFQGFFITSRSSFAEWFNYLEVDTNQNSIPVAEVRPFLGSVYKFIGDVVEQLFYNKNDLTEWIRMSNINVEEYHPLLVLRLVALICLVYLNSWDFFDLLVDLLGRSYITEQLPSEFYDVLRRSICPWKHSHNNNNVFAEAFKKIQDPLVIVSLRKNCSQFDCPDAIFVNMTVKQSREDINRVLFPETVEASSQGAIDGGSSNSCAEVLSSGSHDRECSELAPENSTNISGEEVPMNYSYFWGIFEALTSPDNGSDTKSLVSNPQEMKVDVEKSIHLVSTVMTDCRENHIDHNDENLFEEVASMLDELKQLSAALDLSELEPGLYMSTMGELSRRLQSRRQNVEPILSRLFMEHGALVEKSKTCTSSVEQDDENDGNSRPADSLLDACCS